MPPSIRYINQSAPFWDFVASLEDGEHPFFGAGPAGPHPVHTPGSWGPWGHPSWHHGGMPHRGDPQAAANAASPAANQSADESPATEKGEQDVDMDNKEKDNNEVPDPPEDTPREPGEGCRRHCQGGRRHCGGPGGGERGRGRAWGHHHRRHGGPHGGPHGEWASRFAPGFGPGFRMLSNLFPQAGGAEDNGNGDWAPEVDVFDAPTAYVVHMSLPGANKEDVGVTWDAERSELQVAGVVHRPGDEEFLKTLALDERKVGAFDRKVRLGTRANPAQVDVDGIAAKFDNGILIIEVPKMLGEFVDVKKVDIE